MTNRPRNTFEPPNHNQPSPRNNSEQPSESSVPHGNNQKTTANFPQGNGVNQHSMRTRSKSGIYKTKVYSVELFDNTQPTTVEEALK